MAISLQKNIQTPKREDWRAFSPINASDPKGIIEPAQQHYARRRCKFHQLPGPFETNSSAFTQANNVGPNLDEFGSIATVRRPDSAGTFRIDFAGWATDAEVRVVLSRLEQNGNLTQLSQGTDSSTSDTPELVRVSFTVSDSDRRYGGSASNDVAPLVVYVEYRALATVGDLGRLAAINVWETELIASQIP